MKRLLCQATRFGHRSLPALDSPSGGVRRSPGSGMDSRESYKVGCGGMSVERIILFLGRPDRGMGRVSLTYPPEDAGGGGDGTFQSQGATHPRQDLRNVQCKTPQTVKATVCSSNRPPFPEHLADPFFFFKGRSQTTGDS